MRSVESGPARPAVRHAPFAPAAPLPDVAASDEATRWIAEPATALDGPNCVYLSPHHDDVCFSLGGLVRWLPGGRLINLFTRSGYSLTPPAGAAPDIDAITNRRIAEDDAFAAACRLTKVDLGLPDAPLLGRGAMDLTHVDADCTILRPMLLSRLQAIADATPAGERLTLFCPAGIGGHANHVATMHAIADALPELQRRYRVLFYEDLPYAANPDNRRLGLLRLFAVVGSPRATRLAADFGCGADAKLAAIQLYRSQLGTTPTTCERFSPRLPDQPARLHEAVWEFGPRSSRRVVRAPMRSGTRPAGQMKSPTIGGQGLRPFAALLSHGPGTERPMYISLSPVWPAGASRPLVSALMVTANRPDQARLAIDCYRRQSWPNRELVIADAGADLSLEQWIATLNDRSIRYLRIAGDRPALGAMRNLLAGRSHGEFLCVWDDDDLFHPHRIAMQMAAIDQIQAEACLLARVTVWWPSGGELAITQHRPWEGTLLCRREAMPRYPALGRSEDTPAVNALLSRSRVIQIDAPDLYIYVRHATNTSGDEHFRAIVSNATARRAGAGYGAMLARLTPAYPIRGYLDAIAQRTAARSPA